MSEPQPDALLGREPFALFGLEPHFSIDLDAARERYRDLQRIAHPDRHSAADPTQRRLAAQLAADINSAWNTLKDPVARARHLLELRGIDSARFNSAQVPPAILMEQMELREALETAVSEADPLAAIDRLLGRLRTQQQRAGERLQTALTHDDLDTALAGVQEMQFLARLQEEALRREETLDTD